MIVPKTSDFGEAVVSVTAPAGSLTHAVLLLHGLGDTIENYTKLANRLGLNHAVVIAVQAPMPMPFEMGGFHWGDDLVFSKDPLAGGGNEDDVLSPDAPFSRSRRFLSDNIIREVLVEKCGFDAAENIIIWGYGQGAMAALDVAACSMNIKAVISIGGWIPASVTPSQIISLPRTTKVLLCRAQEKTAVSGQHVDTARRIFSSCKTAILPTKGDRMPNTFDEMAPILSFLSELMGGL
ncbi:Alpha/Beta hydrolase protein [Dipodascopsis uninucleata]